MPHMDSMVQECEGSIVMANIDFCHGSWQLGLHEKSQEIMSIQTPLGVYSPRRTLQGGMDSGNHFQLVTSKAFEGKMKRLLQWIDDFLLHAPSKKELLIDIRIFLEVCKEFGFKIHAEKSSFFLKEAKFCGKIISADGVRFDPRNMAGIVDMKKPEKANELQQLLCAANWMRTSIPDYARLVDPLQKLLESAYKSAGKRTKKAVSKISILDQWGTNHTNSFNSLKTQLTQATKLAHPKKDYQTCLLTDASDTHWSGILTQRPMEDEITAMEEQQHDPLAFLSGSFTGASFNWSIAEKEGFAIIESMTRLDFITAACTTSIYTDQANLVYIFDPLGMNPGIAKHTASKLTRWALKLNEFRFIIEHISGDQNVWADMLTRWAVQPIRFLP